MPARVTAFVILWLTGASALSSAQDHTYSSTDITTGLRLYGAQCQLCHGANGDTVAGVNLRLGRFRRAVTDDDLAQVFAKGVPPAMPAFTFSADDARGLVAFIRAGFELSGAAVKVGNIERGREVFAGRGACTRCHRLGSEGPRAAPELTDIGTVRTAGMLQRSLLDPSAGMLPINRPVTIVTTSGRTIKGRRVNEDTFSVQLVDETAKLVSVEKRDIKSFEAATSSPMPSVRDTLSADEVADLVAYLLSLRGVQ